MPLQQIVFTFGISYTKFSILSRHEVLNLVKDAKEGSAYENCKTRKISYRAGL